MHAICRGRAVAASGPTLRTLRKRECPLVRQRAFISVYAGLAYGDGFEVDGFNCGAMGASPASPVLAPLEPLS